MRPPRDPRGAKRDAPPADALAVQDAIRQINAIWLGGRVARLSEFVRADVVMIAPAFQARMEGIRAVIDSFQTFIRNARVHAFRESEMQIDVWEDTAMATYRFDMTYEYDGVTYDEAGREIWLFTRTDRRWRLAWRHQLPLSRAIVSQSTAPRSR